MMKHTLLHILFLLPVAVMAQEAPLSLSQCINMAKTNAHAIQASQYKLSSAKYDYLSTLALSLPSVSASWMGLYSSAAGSYAVSGGMLPVFNADGTPSSSQAYFPGLSIDYDAGFIYNAGIKVEQPLYMGGKIRTGKKMARLGKYMAEENLRMTTAEIIMETSQAYAAVVKAREVKQVAQAYHALLEELMRAVEKSYRHGVKPKNDVLKVQVKLSESTLNLRRADNAVKLACMNLCHYIGRPLTDSITVSDSLPRLDGSSSGGTDISSRPEHVILKQKSELAYRQIDMARSQLRPSIGLVGQYGYLHGMDVGGQNLWNDWDVAAGVQVSIPLFHFGEKANKIRSAKAAYNETVALQREKDELMTLEMTQTAHRMDEASLEITLAENEVKAANENLRMSNKQYSSGMESLSDHLEAYALWQEAHYTLIDARMNHYILHLEYLKTTGRLTDVF